LSRRSATPPSASTTKDTLSVEAGLSALAKTNLDRLREIAARARGLVIKMAHDGKTPHVGSALSSVDILVALYFSVLRVSPQAPLDPDRDRFVMSKGHGCMALYAVLAEAGFFPASILDEYAVNGGRLAEHPGPGCVPGIELATGSLGHGLSVGAGLALGARMRGIGARSFVLLSDGECQEGTVWEAACFAAVNQLDNLVAVVDYNGLSAMQSTFPALEPLADKWRAFGWEVAEVNGHDLDQLTEGLHYVPVRRHAPTAIIAHTLKGRGVSFMENDLEWHYRPPSDEDLRMARRELGLPA
jgi:transketolase